LIPFLESFSAEDNNNEEEEAFKSCTSEALPSQKRENMPF